MKSCAICNGNDVHQFLDMGNQPVTNRFLQNAGDQENSYPLAVGFCRSCGLVQLTASPAADALTPIYDWIFYNEPESHLDSLVDIIRVLPGISPEISKITGLSYKDDTTLNRLEVQGFEFIKRIDARTDLGVNKENAGIELIQGAITHEVAKHIVKRSGLTDILVVRHILEHTVAPSAFLAGLKELVTDKGYIVLEVPDCEKAFRNLDYTTIWEEHRLYFTQESFRQCLHLNGFQLHSFHEYKYPFENSLVAIVQPAPLQSLPSPFSSAVADTFGVNFVSRKGLLRNYFTKVKQQGNKIAIYGAGHLACAYLNYFDLGAVIDIVVDDNVHKQGLYMPGSKIPILHPSALLEQGVKLCLLALIPELEPKIVARHDGYAKTGGVFASIFPGSPLAVALPVR
jgi:hypothetical protein